MSTHSASLPKRPHSPSPSSNSPPAKRRAQSPEEGELDDPKPARTQSPSSSPSPSRDDTPGAGGTGGTRSTSPSEPSLGTKNSKHAFPFSTHDRDRDRKRDRGDFYRPSSSPRRHNHNHSGMFDSYRPDDNDHDRPTRSRSRSRSRVDSNSPVARRHRLPPRPASPPPQPPLHSSFERNGYDRNGGAPGYGNERNSAPGVYDRWQPPTSSSSSSYVNGRGREPGRTRNPYAESAPRGSTPNGNGPSGLRPLDTPGAPMAGERVGIEEGRVESWEPRPDRDRGRQFGREWDRERGRDDSRGWDRDRGKNRVPLANIPPNPPQVPVDPKITDTLNDTIARIEREANEADAKKGAGGEGKESKEASGGGKPKVLRRTAEQEMQAYGRKFVGTSQLKDYAISEKLGEGTFGEVHKATHIVSKRVVALKRILMHNEKEGVPVTALREIKILKMLSHPSVVPVCDMVVEAATRDRKGSLYMVFPYMDHDLAGLLENPAVKFSPSQIKLYMRQLLEGTEYLHRNKILHRDLKAANLLINNNGSLQIADFGLARPYSTSNPGWDARGDAAEWDALKGGVERGGGGARYTNCVVTRWYRPPELLMGEARYGCAIDLWGVGCIMGEMWTRRPILCGNSDADQLEKIWELCGTPDDVIWPGWRELPGMDGVKPGFRTKLTSRVKQFFAAQTSMDEHGVDLIVKLLTLNPAARITAFEALDHDYFWTEPLPCDPSSLPKYNSSHEYDKRKKAEQPPIGGPMLGPGPGGPGYPMPMPPMQGGPPGMHCPPGGGFRPPGGWGGPNGGPPPYNHHPPHQGRGFGRGFQRGGGGGRHFHHHGPPPGPGPNFGPGPGPGGPGPGPGGNGPPMNFSGYVRPPVTSGPADGGPAAGGGSFLPPPLGTHSREHRQMRERNLRMNGHGPGPGPVNGGRGGPPPRDFSGKPGGNGPPPPPPPSSNADTEFLPYG